MFRKVFDRVVVPLFLLIGGFYGTTSIGLINLAPGTRTGFSAQIRTIRDTSRLILSTTGSKSLKVSVRLTFVADSIAPNEYTARLTTGDTLRMIPARVDSLHWQIEISGNPSSPNPSRWEKFVWPNDKDVELTRLGGSPGTPAFWAVFPDDGPEDNAHLESRRRTLMTVQLVLFAAFLLASAWIVFRPKEVVTPQLTAEALVKALIASVEGDTKKQTKQMRTILEQLRTGAAPNAALKAAKLDPKVAPDLGVFIKARNAIREQLASSVTYFRWIETLMSQAPN